MPPQHKGEILFWTAVHSVSHPDASVVALRVALLGWTCGIVLSLRDPTADSAGGGSDTKAVAVNRINWLQRK